MKLKNCILLLLLTVIILHEDALRACGGHDYGPFYNPQSYIDPGEKSTRFDWSKYGRSRNFKLLVRQYAVLQANQEDTIDITARKVSEQKEAESYAMYLQGVEYFNAYKYAKALDVFLNLQKTAGSGSGWPLSMFKKIEYSWVKEASTYMVARCQLVASQNDWDGYNNSTEMIDQDLLQSADSSFQEYLKAYPDGLYAKSARSMSRKMYFLSGKQSLLDQEIKQVMWKYFPASHEFVPGQTINENIIYEFQNHFEGEVDFAHDSPMLLAYEWFGSPKPDSLDFRLFEAREKDFSAYPRFFQFLRAYALYKLERYQELLEKTPEEQPIENIMWLSIQILRARSFEKVGDSVSALKALEQMHHISPEDALDFEIAYLKLNHNDGLWLFTNSSPIVNVRNLRVFALYGLTDKELEAAIAMKDIAGDKRQVILAELTQRYIPTGRFQEFTQLMNKESVAIFMPVKAAVAILAANPDDARALVEVGEFLMNNYINPQSTFEGGVCEILDVCSSG